MKQLLTFVILSCLFIGNSVAQDCQVLLENIKGVYTGECQNGKASGKGKSVGIDSYEGAFLNGYPEGSGMYIWKDGHYFVGLFKKGKMEGAGDMYYEAANGQDSVITGFWKKDKYVGMYEKPYIIHSTTSRINRVSCQLSKKTGDGSINLTSTGISSIPIISDISVVSGQFINKSETALSNGHITRLQQMKFPFRAIFYLNNGEYFEITFSEPADYDVTVSVM